MDKGSKFDEFEYGFTLAKLTSVCYEIQPVAWAIYYQPFPDPENDIGVLVSSVVYDKDLGVKVLVESNESTELTIRGQSRNSHQIPVRW